MKKLLMILGALTLTATPSLVVMSCATKTSAEYTAFMELANATKPIFNVDGSVKQPGSTLIYYLGAGDNYSSLSFEYALKTETNTNDLSAAFDVLNNSAKPSSNNVTTAFQQLTSGLTFGYDVGLKDVEVKYNDDDERWEYVHTSTHEIFADNTLSEKIQISGLHLDAISDLWTNSISKGIINDFIKPSIARMTYQIELGIDDNNFNSETKQVKKDEIYAKAKTSIDTRINELTSAKGPVFLIIRNGEFIGYLNGYKLYNTPDVMAVDDRDAYKSKSDQYAANDLIRFFEIWQKMLPFQDLKTKSIGLLDEIYKAGSTVSFNFNETNGDDYKNFITHWDNGASVDTDDDTSSGETEDGEDTESETEAETTT